MIIVTDTVSFSSIDAAEIVREEKVRSKAQHSTMGVEGMKTECCVGGWMCEKGRSKSRETD